MTQGHRVIVDTNHGYRRLDPLPSDPEIAAFYQSRYYDLIRKGGRAPEIGRLMAGGDEAASERRWLHKTLFADIAQTLLKHAPGSRILDVGAGTGELVSFLSEHGFAPVGVEPSEDAAGLARDKGLEVHGTDLEAFALRVEAGEIEPFDGVVLVNVLEHVPDPVGLLRAASAVLRDGGVLSVRVPNDFTVLQEAAEQATGKRAWWVAAPDHINYFDFCSLERVFRSSGFEPVDMQSDWPMELFLVMGQDYIGTPSVGKHCHHQRVKMELALPQDVRRTLYRSFAEAGLGRNCLMFGTKRSR